MKKTLFALVLLLSPAALIAQDFPDTSTTHEELEMKKYDKDTSAHAVVLNEFGKAAITVTSSDAIKLVFEYHVKIKIFDSKAFNKGTIAIGAYNAGELTDDVDEISGSTTYIDDAGVTQKINLDPEKIYKEKSTNNITLTKFALPALRNGCIIEYRYRSSSPYIGNFHPWFFQEDIPKVYSEYDVHIPGFWTYNTLIRGSLELTKKSADVELACFSTHGAYSECAHMVYGMKDIPAFVMEDYMTAPKNFESALYFELSDYTNPYTGLKKKYAKEWADVDYDLKRADYFGGQIKHTSVLKPIITPLIAGKTNDLDKAKAIYAYLQKNIKWNNQHSRGSTGGIAKALENHRGNVADINLALVTALDAAGINTEAVLLSTRENGVVNRLYPTENDFNYVIAKVTIDNKSYFLDATDPLLSFGMLPLRCLNGKGRAMSMDKPSYWVDLSTGQTRKSTFALDLTLENDGKIKGTITRYSLGYDAYQQRVAIKKFNSVDEYVDDLANKLGRINIIKSNISGLDSLDMPLTETYEVELKGYKSLNNRLTFNPFIFDRITINPFKMAERTYPVDWGVPNERRFVLTMHLPEEYKIEESPQKVAIAMPNNGGRFITDFQSSDNIFTFSHVTQFNKSVYGPDEYPYLKELFNRIIQSEKAELVFRKKI